MANEIIPVPDGMMRVWDAEKKQVILLPEPQRPDNLTFSLRMHDPKEKSKSELAASWVILQIPREDLSLPIADFMAKHIAPHLTKLKQLKLT